MKLTLLFFYTVLLFFSCSVDKTKSNLALIPTTPLKGKWQLNEFIWTQQHDSVQNYNAFITKSFIGNNYEVSFDKKHSFPIVSLIIDSVDFFGYEKGIYIPGKKFAENGWNDWWPDGNYRDNKKYVNGSITFFDKNQKELFNRNITIRIHGQVGYYPMKPLRIKAKKKEFPNVFFTNNKTKSFKQLILRNSGGDFDNTYFRDVFIHSIANELSLETQSYSPHLLFINGEYWGIHNVREKYDNVYFKNHFNIDEKNLDIVENCGDEFQVVKGDGKDYLSFIDSISLYPPKSDSFFDFLNSKIDVKNYIDYNLVQLYFGNIDWPGNNYKAWKSKNGKWRWLIFDFDYSTGLEETTVSFNSVKHATIAGSTKWYNEDCSTYLLRTSLKNPTFKKLFLNRYNELYKTNFNSNKLLQRITEFEKIYDLEMSLHIARWGYPKSKEQWYKEIEVLKNYVINRKKYFDEFLIDL